MRKKIRVSFILCCILLYGIGLSFYSFAATYDESGLVVQGSQTVVNRADANDPNKKTKVTFTFKTTDANYLGFICGGYALKYNPDKMDLDLSSITLPGVAGVNGDHSAFTVNNSPAERGMVLINFSNSLPGQDYTLSMQFSNLFKDGSYDPLEIQILNRSEDPLSVMDITNTLYAPRSPVIKSAKISLSTLSVKVNGPTQATVGDEVSYTATVENSSLNTNVNWSIVGQTSSMTKIDSFGKLKIGDDEQSQTIQVVATSQEDPNIKTVHVLKILQKTVPTLDIVGKDQQIKGTKSQYTVKKVPTNQSVTWMVENNTSSNTKIDKNGLLTIGVDESSSYIKLKVIGENGLTSVKQVKLIDKTYTILDVKLLVNEVKVDTNISHENLLNKIEENESARLKIQTNDGNIYYLDVPILSYETNVQSNVVLKQGEYNAIYKLNLPYIMIDDNGNISREFKKTNIIGSDNYKIMIYVKQADIPSTDKGDNASSDKGNISSTNSNKNNEPKYTANTNNKVVTSDQENTLSYILSLYGSLLVGSYLFVLNKRYRKEEKK